MFFFCKGSNKFAAIHCVQRTHLSIQKVMKAMNSSARPPNNHPEIEKFVLNKAIKATRDDLYPWRKTVYPLSGFKKDEKSFRLY